MLSSIFISALLAGPAVAGVITRQNTITSFTTSTITASYAPSSKPAAFSYIPSSSASALPFSAHHASAADLGLNPINGLPAAPPRKPGSAVPTAPLAPSSTVIKPIILTKVNGSMQALFQTGPASTFAVPPSSSPASVSTPLVFRTFTSSKGAPAPTATNSLHLSKVPAASPTLTRLIKTSSAPSSSTPPSSSYSPLLRAPPQHPPILISKKPVTATATATAIVSSTATSTTTLAAPVPTETKTEEPPSSSSSINSDLAALFTSPVSDPYPYPTPKAPKPKPTSFGYPYPDA